MIYRVVNSKNTQGTHEFFLRVNFNNPYNKIDTVNSVQTISVPSLKDVGMTKKRTR